MTASNRIEIDPLICGGKPRIAGHRITVANVVVWHERMGKTPDEIADEHELSLADIYAALAYYFEHREEIDRSLTEGEAFAEMLRQSMPSKVSQKVGDRAKYGSAG